MASTTVKSSKPSPHYTRCHDVAKRFDAITFNGTIDAHMAASI